MLFKIKKITSPFSNCKTSESKSANPNGLHSLYILHHLLNPTFF